MGQYGAQLLENLSSRLAHGGMDGVASRSLRQYRQFYLVYPGIWQTQTPLNERMLIHWGMIAAVYPFWFSVASQIGRLLRLQGTVTAIQIQRRICEQYGERETVSHRARYIIRSFLDWGVIQETNTKGIYKSENTLAVDDIRLIAWLVEASLYARSNGAVPLKDLIDSPALFPFRIKSIRAETLIAVSPRLDFLRHGLDEDLIMLKK